MKPATRLKKERRLLILMKKAADQSSDALVLTTSKLDNNNPKILYINNTFCKITGYNFTEVLGKSTQILHGPKTDLTVLARLRKKLSSGQSFYGKIDYYRKDGSQFAAEVDISPVFSDDGIITHFLYIMKDISAKSAIEESKEELVNVVSHELKTPLTAIKGFLGILKKRMGYKTDNKSKEYLSIIDSEVERVIGLTSELLEASRIKTTGIQPSKKLCDLDIVIKQVIKNIRVTSLSHKIRRRGKIGTLVNCDPDRITQVLSNLLTNAIKYSPSSQQIYLEVKKDAYHVIVSIKDFGIGIPYDKQETIFERYYRATDKSKSVSSGIGLYVASEIVRNHGGSIWVDSEEGKGSTFTFSLPL